MATMSAVLLNGELSIPSQHKTVEEFCAEEAAKHAAETRLTVNATCANTSTPTSSRSTSPTHSNIIIPLISHRASKGKRAYVEDSTAEEEEPDNVCENAYTNLNPAGKFTGFGNSKLFDAEVKCCQQKGMYIHSIKRT
jgi:hypothetical protein